MSQSFTPAASASVVFNSNLTATQSVGVTATPLQQLSISDDVLSSQNGQSVGVTLTPPQQFVSNTMVSSQNVQITMTPSLESTKSVSRTTFTPVVSGSGQVTTKMSSSFIIQPSSTVLTSELFTSSSQRQSSPPLSNSLAVTTEKLPTNFPKSFTTSRVPKKVIPTNGDGSSSTKPIPIIVGLAGVIGVAAFILIIIGILFIYLHRKKKAKKRAKYSESHITDIENPTTSDDKNHGEKPSDGARLPSISVTTDKVDKEETKQEDSSELKQKEADTDTTAYLDTMSDQDTEAYEDVAEVPPNKVNTDEAENRPMYARPSKETKRPRPKTRKVNRKQDTENSTSQDNTQPNKNLISPRPKTRKKKKVIVEDSSSQDGDEADGSRLKPKENHRSGSSWRKKITASFSKADWRPRPKTRRLKDKNKELHSEESVEMQNSNKESTPNGQSNSGNKANKKPGRFKSPPSNPPSRPPPRRITQAKTQNANGHSNPQFLHLPPNSPQDNPGNNVKNHEHSVPEPDPQSNGIPNGLPPKPDSKSPAPNSYSSLSHSQAIPNQYVRSYSDPNAKVARKISPTKPPRSRTQSMPQDDELSDPEGKFASSRLDKLNEEARSSTDSFRYEDLQYEFKENYEHLKKTEELSI